MLTWLARRRHLRHCVARYGPTPEQQARFEAEGALLLERFIPDEDIDELNREFDEYMAHPERAHPDLTVDLYWGSRPGRTWLHTVDSKSLAEHGFKINNAFLYNETVLRVFSSDRIQGMLGGVFHDSPVVFNSLYLRWGSGQAMHVDTWFMPPPRGSQMAAIWICLEDVHPDAGPLGYIVGGHRIPPFVFSNTLKSHVPEELPQAVDYVLREREKRRLEIRSVLARAGDVFIWHPQLPHCGQPIKDYHRTRRSLVAHFFAKSGVPRPTLRSGPGSTLYQYNPIQA